jgi:hypothetical protein
MDLSIEGHGLGSMPEEGNWAAGVDGMDPGFIWTVDEELDEVLEGGELVESGCGLEIVVGLSLSTLLGAFLLMLVFDYI